jgi:hypothetical protein
MACATHDGPRFGFVASRQLDCGKSPRLIVAKVQGQLIPLRRKSNRIMNILPHNTQTEVISTKFNHRKSQVPGTKIGRNGFAAWWKPRKYGAGEVQSKAKSYREHAAICSELAREAKDAESKAILEEMRRVWLRLAELVERFELT